jgi:hypothetical protein
VYETRPIAVPDDTNVDEKSMFFWSYSMLASLVSLLMFF